MKKTVLLFFVFTISVFLLIIFVEPVSSQHNGNGDDDCATESECTLNTQCSGYCSDAPECAACTAACRNQPGCSGIKICTWTQDDTQCEHQDGYDCNNWCSWGACIWDNMSGSYLQSRQCCGSPANELELRGCSPGGNGNGNGGPPPGSPSCTVDLTPDTSTFAVGVVQTFTASVVPSNGTVLGINFLSQNTNVVVVNPAIDTSFVYSTKATGVSEGSTNIIADVYMGGIVLRCTDTSIVTIAPPGPWWQAEDTDIMATGNISSTIPDTCSGACTPNLILDGDGGYPGVAAYGGSLSVGSGTVSRTDWEANTALSIRKTYNYDYFSRQIPADVNINEITTATIDGTALSSGGTVTDGYYWYHYDAETYGDLTINSNVDLGDRKVILFVKDGNLNINDRIFLNDGTGFFVAFVGKNTSGGKGDIVVDGSVSHPVQPELEGMYLADNQFFTGTLGAGTDTQLHVRGSIAALGGMVLERDLVDNTEMPAEFFEFAPDQTLLFPKELRIKRFRWEEVAP